MKIFFLRHGPPSRAGADPGLSEAGRIFTAWAARGIGIKVENVEAIVASPLIRARETAEIVSEILPGEIPVRIDPGLGIEGGDGGLFGTIERVGAIEGTAVLVSHEPVLVTFLEAVFGVTLLFDRCGGTLVDWEQQKLLWSCTGQQFQLLGRA